MTEKPTYRLDPVTTRVIAGALENAANEMGHKLMRMAYSSVIRESEDFGAALLDAAGRQLAETSLSTPLQLGPIAGYMRGIRRIFAERGDEMRPGDVIVHNSPYHGASHGPDIGICVPAFLGGELVGFAVTTAHHLDIGSSSPGSTGIVDSVDAYAEGLQFKAIKAYDAGVRQKWVWRLIGDNVRAAELVLGDLEAQVAAARIGAERYLEVVRRHGLRTVLDAAEDQMDYAELRMRQEIEKIPDGTYTAVGHLDGYLGSSDPRHRDLEVHVAVHVAGSDILVDLSGTSPQVDDRPINMPFEGTTDVAVYLTLRTILLDSARHEYVPQNAGIIRPIRVEAPLGTLANPRFPAPTIARFLAGNVLADTLMHALAPVLPEQVSAGVGNAYSTAFTGLQDGGYWVYMDIGESAYGGRFGKDGMDAVDTLYANTRNNPIEDIESHYPLRVTRYELAEGSGGAGRWRGGMGTVREVEFLADGRFSIEGDGHKYAPWGFLGGESGSPGRATFNPGRPGEQDLPSKLTDHPARAGDVLRLVSPAGGGYGSPGERDPAAVRRDLEDGLVDEGRTRAQRSEPR